ncbi:MAG: acyl carrier protein [Burkholderiales bacterium]
MLIREFIARDLLFTPGTFPYDDRASFLEEGIIDSLGVMELVGFVQQAFGFLVDQDEILPENFGSVTALTAYVARRTSAPAANS